jgi:hypothetical protein
MVLDTSFAFYPGETPGTKFSNNSPPPGLKFLHYPGGGMVTTRIDPCINISNFTIN